MENRAHRGTRGINLAQRLGQVPGWRALQTRSRIFTINGMENEGFNQKSALIMATNTFGRCVCVNIQEREVGSPWAKGVLRV